MSDVKGEKEAIAEAINLYEPVPLHQGRKVFGFVNEALPSVATPLPNGTDTGSGPTGSGPDRLRAKSEEISRRGSKPGVARGPYRKRSGPADGISPAPLGAASPVAGPLFTPENTGRLLRIPFDLAAIKTNCAGWQLDEKEQRELVSTGVPCLNEWCTVSPKWVALSLFSMSLIGVVASKALAYVAYLEALKLERERLARKEPEPVPVPIKAAAPSPNLPPVPEWAKSPSEVRPQ